MFIDNEFDNLCKAYKRFYDMDDTLLIRKCLIGAEKVDITKHSLELISIQRVDIPPVITSPWLVSWFEVIIPKGTTKTDHITKVGFLTLKQRDNISHRTNIFVETETNGKKNLNILGVAVYNTEDDGAPIKNAEGSFIYKLALNENDLTFDDISTKAIVVGIFEDCFRFYVSAVGLLNCKNVELENHYPSIKLNKKRIKSGKRPLSEHKTVIIKEIGKPKAKVIDEPGSRQRMHKRRGAWADYRSGNGLFGKLHGIYYKSACYAGDESLGIITHDYEVY